MTIEEIDAEILKIQRDIIEASRGAFSNHLLERSKLADEKIRKLVRLRNKILK